MNFRLWANDNYGAMEIIAKPEPNRIAKENEPKMATKKNAWQKKN